jgi:hypothetical protein
LEYQEILKWLQIRVEASYNLKEERTPGLREDKTPGLTEENTPGMEETKKKRAFKKLSCGCIVDEKGVKVKLCELHGYVKNALKATGEG